MNVLDMFSLRGRVAVVTGGAGLYGRQVVEAIAEAGAVTYTASRRLEALDPFAEELRGRGLDVRALPLDLASESSILALRDEVFRLSGRVDVLINNAVLRPMSKGYEDTAEAFEESMRVNATGLFIITRAFGDVMAEHGKGSIVNIGSIQAFVGPDPTNYVGTSMHAWYPDYFFHKGGVVNFTRFVASYYGAKGVRCNAVHPGGFLTEKMPEAFVRSYSSRTFLGRLAGEDDLKGAVVFLASDASAYVTGAQLMVDGGYTAK